MIQARDLRTGNLLRRNEVIFSINDIHGASGLVTMYPGEGGEWHGRRAIFDYEPIPLDEDWLRKFGFVKSVRNWIWFEQDPVCLKKRYEGFMICWMHGKLRPEIRLINQVHQLQNVIFALTGKELVLNTEEGK